MMDRNRETRRAAMVTTNGFSRRRHRNSSLSDSPEDDRPVDLRETAKLRDRTSKKDRDRDRERDRDRDRSGRTKRFIHGSGGDDFSDESVSGEDEEDPDNGPVRYTSSNQVSTSSLPLSLTNHRKSYPPQAMVFRKTQTWKASDEMIGVSVPRKARSASTKRSHDCWSSGGVGEQIHRQASSSPVRPTMVSAVPVTSPEAAPISLSSSNVSIKKKKIKPNGPKQRPLKSHSKSPSSIQDDIEIEVAEVLYGLMRQSQGPSKQEMISNDVAKLDSNRSSCDSKSRVSSPVSNSPSVPPQLSSVLPQNSSSVATPLTAVAPKSKRPRPVSCQEENSPVLLAMSYPISPIPTVEAVRVSKQDGPPPSFEKNSGSALENGMILHEMMNYHGSHTTLGPQSKSYDDSMLTDVKPLVSESGNRDGVSVKVEDSLSTSLKEAADNRVFSSIARSSSTIIKRGNHKEDKYEIDLMAAPLRSSPEREERTEYGGSEDAQKSMAADEKAGNKPTPIKDDKAVKGDDEFNEEREQKKVRPVDQVADEVDLQKPNPNKDRDINLLLDLEKGSALITVDSNLNHQHLQPVPKASSDDGNTDKTTQSKTLQLQMSISASGWSGGLPSMGYVAPLQGVETLDGGALVPPAIQPPDFLFSQPRTKRCAIHCYIARNIQSHQQFVKMNTLWPSAACSAPLFGAKLCNLNVIPSVDLHGDVAESIINHVQDKGQAVAFFPGQPAGKDKVSQAANKADVAQKRQLLLRQSLLPGAQNNVLHGCTVNFPMGHEHAAAASASACPSSVKSAATSCSSASKSASNSDQMTSLTTTAAVAPVMSFKFPNMPANESQYMAIVGNSPYSFPVPAHVGAPPPYRGSHAQAIPFFNGSFYPSQVLHQSQLQRQLPPPSPHQNTSISSAALSSQKHLQKNLQQRPQGSDADGGCTIPSLQMVPAPKGRTSQFTHHEMGSEDSPSTADSCVSWQNSGVYGQNFALPFHPSNFALVTPSATHGGATNARCNGNGIHGENQQQQQPQTVKRGIECLTPPAFAMSFASINGIAPGIDISTMAQNHAILENLPEAARNNYQIMAAMTAAQAAQQKKDYLPTEDGKARGGHCFNLDDESKALAARTSVSVGQSFAFFARPDMAEKPVSTMTGNNVVDSSAQSLNLMSGTAGTSLSSAPSAIGNAGISNPQQQQMIPVQKQQQFVAAAVAAARSKTPSTCNRSLYTEHLSSPHMASKFSTSLPGFPPTLVQSNSREQSSPWGSSLRAVASQVSSSAAMKSLPQQQSKTQQSHAQVTFGANPKSSIVSQGLQAASGHQALSPPIMVGSPSTSISKSSGGSPRTTASSSAVNKPAQASTTSLHHGKNSPSMPSQNLSSPAGGRNVPSILMSSTSAKLPQQPQLSKQLIQQAQSYSNAYMQAQAPCNTNTSPAASAPSGYHLQRHQSGHQQQQPPLQKSQGFASTFSSGVLSLAPICLTSTGTSDPAKVAAAAAAATSAANCLKGGLPSQGVLHAAQFSGQSPGNVHHLIPAGFPYAHIVPPVPVKSAEQKQPAA
ncbi:hypothetical protein Nepgr_030319 [Nepenthes gracilis]|uniref:Protein TIME FOR COFFEE-like n=1 Tax=Nepenthes gracilis TaxID=150966 RepID=A0AAD3TGG8_NEPGR|nr:hypothetical protein Nepgr_030319 [Nepenthes gracilis]